MIRRYKRTGLVMASLVVLWIAVGCGNTKGEPSGSSDKVKAERVELVVSAAASLTDSLRQLQNSYEAKHPGVQLRFNFGASGTLEQQIEQGAPADLFISASPKNMKPLVDKDMVDPDKEKVLLRNELVLITPKDANMAISEPAQLSMPAVKRIAIGEPDSVPAGGYAKQALVNAKLWDTLKPKLIYAKDVRQVLTYVESGNADAGFVYKTDAMTSKQVSVSQSLDSKLYDTVEYPVGIVKATKHQKEAQAFYDYIGTNEAQNVFKAYGFTPVP